MKKVANSNYRFTRFREKLIVRSADKPPRQIAIPTVRDKLVLRTLHEELKSYFPDRKHERPQKIIFEIKNAVSDESFGKFVRMDIKSFFPSIDHNFLISDLARNGVKSEISHLVTSAVTNCIGNSPLPEAGVPQGLSISNILAEIYLSDFDKYMKAFCMGYNCLYFRYVDDVLVLTPEGIAKEVFLKAKEKLKNKNLKVHELGDEKNKSEISEISKGTSYLGYQISAGGIRVKDASLQRMFNNVHKTITRFKYDNEDQKNLFRLNLKITGCIFNGTKLGWLHFFSEIDRIDQLHQLDDFVKNKIKGKVPPKFTSKVKSYVRTYYEIIHNHHNTRYIPNFDTINTTEKVNLISLMTNKDLSEIEGWSLEFIDSEFNRLIRFETKRLEADIIATS